MSNLEISTIAAIITVAILLRSTFGFGDAVFAIPLFGLLSDMTVANPALAAVGSVVTALICIEDRRIIEWRHVAYLLFPSILGIPFGIWLLTAVDARFTLIGIGILISTFAIYSLSRSRPRFALPDFIGIPVGFAAGILGGAFNMFGLPVAVYGGVKGWEPERFRILTSSFFLPTGLVAVFGHWYSGLWGSEFRYAFAYSILPALGAMWVGRRLNRSMNPNGFHTFVWAILLLLGLLLLIRNF